MTLLSRRKFLENGINNWLQFAFFVGYHYKESISTKQSITNWSILGIHELRGKYVNMRNDYFLLE
ncbi:hypothetical protein [Heyndrickxia oleronia]|jgi:hypothetical protein|uniref:hypothetical protein n=1 Tax=Heyndrickxia oleronia TaxID=38875 RepID=UPI000AB017AC|nr:hypothetical protein [Heyndrickxia oleronia]MBU5210486.1 hypothetical protein [Heyndrickxia oleronia]MCI1763917.1 hypothetical protein [Heyndrickxia oleronia]